MAYADTGRIVYCTKRNLLWALVIPAMLVPPWLMVKAQTRPAAPIYVVIDLTTTTDAFMKAVQAAEPQSLQAAGGRTLIATGTAAALDGPAPPKRFVMIEFPSLDKARQWYGMPAVQKAAAERAAISRAFIVEGVAAK